MKVTKSEQLIIAMLCEIYEHLKIKGEIDHNFVQSAILGGHYWALEWQYQGLFHDHEDNKEFLSEVVSILDMWSFIEHSYKRLSQEEKSYIEREAQPIGKDVYFSGFDGNNESDHMGIAHFLIEKVGRFSAFKGRNLNSHLPSLPGHRRMLAVFEDIRRTLDLKPLTANQIADILKARIHPGNRK